MPDYKSIYSGDQIDLAVGKVLTPDASPTTNSQNLVTSGGVKAAIDNAAAEFGDIETRVESIEGKIPSGASSSNKLATASDVAAKYTKPGTGIPASDLASGVQTSLGKADSAYQKPVAGIPKTDLASDVQLSLQKADEAAPQSTTYNKTEVDEKVAELDASKTGQNDYAPALVAGSADGLLGVSKAQEFTFAAVPEGTGNGAARIGRVKGNSLAWNQLTNPTPASSRTDNNCTITSDGYGKITIVVGEGGASGNAATHLCAFGGQGWISGHKYLCKVTTNFTPSSSTVRVGNNYYSWWDSLGYIWTCDGPQGNFSARVVSGCPAGTYILDKAFVIDLTLMFGEGKEPSTVAEFEALYNELYYPYNAGAIINNDADTLVTNGFNQWDEEWESGYYDTSGVPKDEASSIRSKTYCACLPNSTYYVKGVVNKTVILFYDANYTLIQRTAIWNATIVSPAAARYFKLSLYQYGTTYKNDIAISISSARNGKYEPHWRRTLPLALTSLRGRLNGTGERVAIFPDGMKRAGDAYDEVYGNIAIKRVGSVDMGTLTWTKATSESAYGGFFFMSNEISTAKPGWTNNVISPKFVAISGLSSTKDNTVSINANRYVCVQCSAYSDAATFKTAMNGVMLNFEAATPGIYILDEPIPSGFAVGAGGTMHAIPDAIDGTPTAPFAADIAFPRDNYGITSKNSTVALLEALKTAGKIASYTIGYDANGDMTFNIT